MAEIIATTGILLRKTKLTESSLIVTWLTVEHGKVKTVAKGARQARSKFAGVLDLFHRCEFEYSRSGRSELHALREAVLLEPYENLRLDFLRTSLAAYFVELLEMVTEPEHPVPELFDLLARGLQHLQGKEASRRGLWHFEAELARLLGVAEPPFKGAAALERAHHRLPAGRKDLLGRMGD